MDYPFKICKECECDMYIADKNRFKDESLIEVIWRCNNNMCSYQEIEEVNVSRSRRSDRGITGR